MALNLDSILGRIGDLDSHESIDHPHYGEIFGEAGRRLVDDNPEMWARGAEIDRQNGGTGQVRPPAADDKPITAENVWTLKLTEAPGTMDMNRRELVMNEMGIQRQLVFPMFGIHGWVLACGG